MILVVIPQSIAIKVSRKYTNLRRQMKNNEGRTYSIEKLKQNISNALSINGQYIDSYKLREPVLETWVANGYRVLNYNHWYYAVFLFTNPKGEVVAKVVDAIYEGDYHNNKMQTKPYESVYKIANLIERMNQLYI